MFWGHSVDTVLEYHNLSLFFWLHAYRQRRQTLKSTYIFSNFQTSMTLTLDRVIRHTIMHHSSTSIYIPNFVQWTDKWTLRPAWPKNYLYTNFLITFQENTIMT